MANKYQKARGRELILRQLQQAIGMWGRQKEADARRKDTKDYRDERAEERKADKEESLRRFETGRKETKTYREQVEARSQRTEGRLERTEQRQLDEFDFRKSQAGGPTAKISGVTPANQSLAQNMRLSQTPMTDQKEEAEIAVQALASEAADLSARKNMLEQSPGFLSGEDPEALKELQRLELGLTQVKARAQQAQKRLELTRNMLYQDQNKRLREAAGSSAQLSEQGPDATSMDSSSLSEAYADMVTMSKYRDTSVPFDGEAVQTAQRMNEKYGMPIPLEIQHMMQGVGMPVPPPGQAGPSGVDLGLELGQEDPMRGGIQPQMPPGIDTRR